MIHEQPPRLRTGASRVGKRYRCAQCGKRVRVKREITQRGIIRVPIAHDNPVHGFSCSGSVREAIEDE